MSLRSISRRVIRVCPSASLGKGLYVRETCRRQYANRVTGALHRSLTAGAPRGAQIEASGAVFHSLWRPARLCLWAELDLHRMPDDEKPKRTKSWREIDK